MRSTCESDPPLFLSLPSGSLVSRKHTQILYRAAKQARVELIRGLHLQWCIANQSNLQSRPRILLILTDTRRIL